ncbi:PKD domain-containing protein [Ilyomonas limi]|uniref:PKD domain-containing protein n=1 Tax=Ilyomonas limi TaxID=2575867 RepID=A0A4U3L223_9BACT|nr:PKD domain-containing protein [Ilyomonas limi]TKK67517.1 PKD domain-containing protein [Ilyomonas limi]
MIKRLLIVLLVCFCAGRGFAGHIAGGELYYQYISAGSAANTNKYQITLRLFRECNPIGQAAQLPGVVRIGIFRNNGAVLTKDVTQSDFILLKLKTPLTCIINKPDVCYQVAYYTFTVDLPIIPEEYVAAYQTCCRSNSILNVQQYAIPGSPVPGEGSTYSCNIPGTNILNNDINSSAAFALKDTVLVCSSKKIDLDFSATDPDGDSLSYSFCAAYNRGASTDASIIAPSAPPYQSVTYKSGYSGESPLGSNIVIDPATGKINGEAPPAGAYVVNVCVTEWRNGDIISVHRKDFIVRVSNCDFAAAELDAAYATCDGFTAHLENESTSSGINSYYWEFGVNGDTSSLPTPDYTFKDTGVYTVKLVVNRGQECSDSTTALVNVFPGFEPAFTKAGGCYKSPVQFTDATSTAYGVVNSWRWDFGDNATLTDTASIDAAAYQFPAPGEYDVKLTVTNSKGCLDSIITPVTITDKPTLVLPFKDTLICKGDTLRLAASSDVPVAYSWLPAYNQLNANTARPLVYPASSTAYSVTADDGNGCIGTDTIQVHVADKVDLQLRKDSVICLTDTVRLRPQTNALYFTWSPANAVDNATSKEPAARPLAATTYQLHAAISEKCYADAAITITPAPYPEAIAGVANPICYGFTTQLDAAYKGSIFEWSPVNSLLNANTLTPIAGPQETTTYTLMVRDTTTTGCPKPVYDTVTVRVIPQVHVFAGNDTNIVTKQPLHLKATGAEFYQWEPATGMTNPEDNEPVVILNGTEDAVTYHVKGTTADGCFGYDTLTVFVYKTLPQIFLPTAFTPNNDGLNDRLIPILAGIKNLELFSIYNRWGQLLYSTSAAGQGWDGTAAGNKQPEGSYIYVIRAIDYLDKPIIKKGSVVLIR